MSRVQCNACGGVYDQRQADGSPYFHACPPLSAAEVKAAIQSGAIKLSAAQQRAVDAAAAADNKTPPAAGEPSRVDTVLGELAIARPNGRNENIRGERGGGDPRQAIADGAGVTKIGDDRPPARKL